MTPAELRDRTRLFALESIKLASALPTDPITAILARQLVRSATSVAANYRSSCRARSKADFISKMTIAEEEADETRFWLDLLIEADIVKPGTVARLLDESDQLTRIFVASIITARGTRRRT